MAEERIAIAYVPGSRREELQTTARIVTVIAFTFVCYLIIGLPLAVLPGFVQDDLGFGSVLAGAVISVQYLATLATRPLAGRSSDGRGSKRTTLVGLVGCGVSGAFLVAGGVTRAMPLVSIALLLGARIVLGYGESGVATGATTWGIARVGAVQSARVISWNGIATYGGLALGAPVGVALAHSYGVAALGVATVVLAALGLFFALRVEPVPVVAGERARYASVFVRVLPFGLGLALGSVGFGSIATFITLFYASRHWSNAALALTVFGSVFVGTRLVFPHAIRRRGGFRVSLVCFAVESVGLLLLWRAGSPLAALIAAGVTGAGFALVFPALAVEAIGRVPLASRGAALSAYSVFFDLALGVAGPVAGYVAGRLGYAAVYSMAAIAAALAFGLTLRLMLVSRRDG